MIPSDDRWPYVIECDDIGIDPALIAALEQLPYMGPWEDDLGNRQAGFAVYRDDETNKVVVAYHDENASSKDIVATVNAHSTPAVSDGTRLVWVRHIQHALDETDKWCARHVEDGISLTPERIAYRKKLRALLDSVASSDDPAGITIPDPPPPPV